MYYKMMETLPVGALVHMVDWDMAVVPVFQLLQQAMSILVLVGPLWMFKHLQQVMLRRIIIQTQAVTSTHVLLVMMNCCVAGGVDITANWVLAVPQLLVMEPMRWETI